MPSARELLEQADALMRRNRSPLMDDIPVLTDSVPEVVRRRETSRSPEAEAGGPEADASSDPDTIPMLTESVAAVSDETASVPESRAAVVDEGDASTWLRTGGAEPSVIGDAPDSIARVPAFAHEEPEEILVEAPVEVEEAFDEELALRDAAEPAPFAGEAARNAEEEAAEDAARKAAEEAALEEAARKAAEAAVAQEAAEEAAAQEAARRAAEESVAQEAARKAAEESVAQEAARKAAEEAALEEEGAARKAAEEAVAQEAARKAAEEAALEEAARKSEEDARRAEEEARKTEQEAARKAEEDARRAEEEAARRATDEAARSAAEDARWASMAEEIRMQVLQRIDLFTDTGLRDQLGARLQPIVDRASADLVATINQHVGDLLRAYVAEAIEREIENWKSNTRNP